MREKRQKIFSGALPSRREREKFEKVLKKVFESVKTLFYKIKKKKLNHDVRLIEKHVRSIEPGSASLNFLNRISIDRKSNWIN